MEPRVLNLSLLKGIKDMKVEILTREIRGKGKGEVFEVAPNGTHTKMFIFVLGPDFRV